MADTGYVKEDEELVKQGSWGIGAPLRTVGGRYVRDGGGFCSPGRWAPSKRSTPVAGTELGNILDRLVASSGGSKPAEALVLRVLLGQVTTAPLEALAAEGRSAVETWLKRKGHVRDGKPRLPTAVIDFELLGLLALATEDPDFAVTQHCREGVKIGYEHDLGRCPAIWPKKTKWRLAPDIFQEEEDLLRENYSSAGENVETLREEFSKQEKNHMMIRTTFAKAKARYKDRLRVAPMAVIDEGSSKRVIHDGTHFVHVNHSIRVPDLELYPTAADVAAAITADSGDAQKYFALKSDISKAHRRIPVSEEDWGLQACAIDPKPSHPEDLGKWEIWLNQVGTYGIGSASWWWGRVGALLLRMIFYSTKLRYGFRFADDFLFLCKAIAGKTLLPLFKVLLLLAILQVPIKWEKTSGGQRVEWIGYLFNFETLQMGLSRRRAEWIATWLTNAAEAKLVSVRDFMGTVGRIGFAAEVLRHLKPFMAPLYAWLASNNSSSVLSLPPALILLSRWFAGRILDSSLVPMRVQTEILGEWFRADAKAEGMVVVVGGWESKKPPREARWYSVDLDPTSAPWAFSRGMPFRTIAALELFATLLCVMAFSDGLTTPGSVTLRLRGITDNQGNQGAVKKHMSTKYPLCLILMELASQLESLKVSLDLCWKRRDENVEADALTNHDFSLFTLSNRVQINLQDLQWKVLPWLSEEAAKLFFVVAELKAVKRPAAEPLTKMGKKKASLRQSDPW